MVYEGLCFRVEARLADKIYGRPFGVDVAFAEPMEGEPEVLDCGSWLTFAGLTGPTVRVYPLEAHIAEKLHAYSMPRSRPNSRVKDLPDIALLGTVREVQGAPLRAAVEGTWAARGTHAVPQALPDPPDAWARLYEEMARANDLPWRTLGAVTEAARRFVDPVLVGRAGVWCPKARCWK